jgi:hypothetical protein
MPSQAARQGTRHIVDSPRRGCEEICRRTAEPLAHREALHFLDVRGSGHQNHRQQDHPQPHPHSRQPCRHGVAHRRRRFAAQRYCDVCFRSPSANSSLKLMLGKPVISTQGLQLPEGRTRAALPMYSLCVHRAVRRRCTLAAREPDSEDVARPLPLVWRLRAGWQMCPDSRTRCPVRTGSGAGGRRTCAAGPRTRFCTRWCANTWKRFWPRRVCAAAGRACRGSSKKMENRKKETENTENRK